MMNKRMEKLKVEYLPGNNGNVEPGETASIGIESY